jgi:ApaG protein
MKTFSQIFKSANEFLIPNELLQQKPYVAITNDIEVSVWPEFVDNKISQIGELFIWAYHVRIKNKSTESIKLLSRYWRIVDECGNVQEIEGEGVVGEKPLILPSGAYQYSSGVHLKYPSGIMSGKYRMEKILNKETFEIKIPNFSLDIPSSKTVLN